ncbi:6463_t:CDS:2 [Paraglomus occultum]|uniref:6463_t:CDS:1 n=1 Tax=Paraglomus occultum TaxID=144539 RepID=A0A9N8W2A2_9GLOM|nr:6463_t:CDS:2 [Paraglomus occultum]
MSEVMFKRILLAVLLVLGVSLPSTYAQCSTNFVNGTDYFPSKVTFDGDSDFQVTYYNSYKIVNNTLANETYVLYCTAYSPTNIGVPSNAKYIQVPVVKSIAVTDISAIGFLKAIGMEKNVTYATNPENVTAPCLQQSISNFTGASNQIGVVFTNTPAADGSYVTLSLSDDMSPLQKADRVKLVSLFFDKEDEANTYYNATQTAYSCHAQNAKISLQDKNKKSIAWVAYDGSAYNIIADSYHMNLTQDAGALPLTTKATSYTNLNDFQTAVFNVDFLIDLTYFDPNQLTWSNWLKLFGYVENDDDNTPDFINKKRVYRIGGLQNPSGHEDWFENAEAMPDIVLKDLISIQYPLYVKSYRPTWLLDFAAAEPPTIVNATDCVSGQSPDTCTIGAFNVEDDGGDDGDNNGDDGNDSNGSHGLAIGLGVAGGLLALASISAGAFILRKKYKEKFFELKEEPSVQLTEVNGEIRLTQIKQ